VPHTATVVTCESRNGHIPPLRLVVRACDPVRRSTVAVSRALGQPFPHCDELFATHKRALDDLRTAIDLTSRAEAQRITGE